VLLGSNAMLLEVIVGCVTVQSVGCLNATEAFIQQAMSARVAVTT
jgi:hypothetical protein